MRSRQALTGAMLLLLGGCTTKATLNGSDTFGPGGASGSNPSGYSLPPPPTPSSRLLRQTALALTGSYPAPQNLETTPSQLEMDTTTEALLQSDGLLQTATDWLYQWLQQESAYRYLHYPVSAEDSAFDLQLLLTDQANAPLYPDIQNPFYLGPTGSAQYRRMMTAILHAYMEPALIWRRILSTGRDIRELLSGEWTIRSQVLEDMYARREDNRPTRTLASIGTPYADDLTRAIGDQWYVVPSGRGAVGILGSLSFLNNKINGRTRSNLVAKSFLCKTIPISDTSGWTPPADCDDSVDPRCDIRSHVAERSCASCHMSLDPMARLWERYQLDYPTSIFMTTNGPSGYSESTDPSGRYLDGPGPRYDSGTPTRDVSGLAARVVADPDFARCLTERAFVSLVGRRFTSDETQFRDALVSTLTEHWKLKDLLRAIVRTPAFAQGLPSGTETSSGPTTDFSQVYALMNRPIGNGGCQVCHIGPSAVPPSPYFGNSKDEVLAALQSRGLLASGRQGRLAQRMSSGEMPPGGRWSDTEMRTMMDWLKGFEVTPGSAPPMDRYRLAGALEALRKTPGDELVDFQSDLIDRFGGNWPLEQQTDYSTVGLVAIDSIARRACTADAIPALAGLPADVPLDSVEVDRTLERMSKRFLGQTQEEAGLRLIDIFRANGGGAAGFSAACVALMTHPAFTE